MRALRALPAGEERWGGVAVAEFIGTTASYVPQVMAPLVRAGWVASATGPLGGYSLTTEGQQVSVLDVMRAVEGWDDQPRCLLACPPDEEESCPLHDLWHGACALFDGALAQLPVRHGLDPPGGTIHGASGATTSGS